MPELLTASEVAKALKVTVAAVRKWQSQGLPVIPLGTRLVRFELAKVLAWLEERAQHKNPSAQAA